MKNHLLLLLLGLGLPGSGALHAQGILLSFFDPATNQSSIVAIDLSTCAVTPVISSINQVVSDFVLADNGTYYITSPIPGNGGNQAGLYTLDPATGATTLLVTIPANFVEQSHVYQLDANTLIISSSASEFFYSYNIATNTLTPLGPANLDGPTDIFQYNGNVYSTFLGTSGSTAIHQMNFSPFSVTPVVTNPLPNIRYAVGVCNNIFSISIPPSGGYSGFTITEYNFNNNTTDAVCLNMPALQGMIFQGFAPDPNNTSGTLCNCTSESGGITPGLYQACGQNPIPIPHLGNQTLDPDDALVFLLGPLGNPSLYDDFPNNVLYVYDTPVATFQPGITVPGVLYRVYPAAGNAAPGSIDFSDICLDIGNPVLIRWSLAPSVTFELLSAPCTTGCQTVRANFSGTPPYVLTYSVTYDNGQTATFTQTANGSVLNLNICPPAGYSGGLTVQATNLVDNVCSCSQ